MNDVSGNTAVLDEEPQASEEAGHGEEHHGHSRWLAHHFDSRHQQFTSSKLGMWVFLLTEILFFSGLFCAYAVYRRNHPEIFFDGHHFLDTTLGAINTAVLLFSSLTMAWAVRLAQLGKKTSLTVALAITLLCAFLFLGIKYQEYASKWHHHLVPGQDRIAFFMSGKTIANWFTSEPTPAPNRGWKPDMHYVEHHLQETPNPPQGKEELEQRVDNLYSFFGIYFALTGLHAVHVICGIIAIGWLLYRSIVGHFSSEYFEPVDCVGLYWHLVDLIWIYLFPLLYLIH